MELITPNTGLIIWQAFVFLQILLFVVSWILILTTKTFDSKKRLTWLLATLLLPIIGSVIFLFSYSSLKTEKL